MSYLYEPVVKALVPHIPLEHSAIAELLASPPDPSMGDAAFPCFTLAKALRKSPGVIAADLAAAIPVTAPLASVTAAGPYLNFTLDRAAVGQATISAILEQGAAWAGSREGEGQTVCIDFCSPNVARRMHLGHLRSTVIGKSLTRLHEALGYKVVRINFLGDWGTQFGKLIAAWKQWGDAEAAKVDPIGELQRLYVKFHNEAKADPALEEEGRAWFRRLEEGDAEARQLWAWIRERSLASMSSTLELLGVGFDDYNGEAFYEDRNQAVVTMLEQLGLLVENEGAQVVDLDGMPPCLILKNDGATLYATRDIAAALHREEVYHPARSLYVVDLGQSLHFRQVFATLVKLGLPWASKLEHVSFGIMRVGGKRLRTRAGDVVYLEDVLAQAIGLAKEELASRSPGMEGLDEVARAIGVGAIIFNDLKQNRIKDIDFNPEEAISFDGETGPYVQYAHARCQSVLRKAAEAGAPAGVPLDDPEWALVLSIARFPEAAHQAAHRCEPHIAARALLEVARAFNQFYHECPVLTAEPATRPNRLALVKATATVLRHGLWLLGLEAPPMRA